MQCAYGGPQIIRFTLKLFKFDGFGVAKFKKLMIFVTGCGWFTDPMI